MSRTLLRICILPILLLTLIGSAPFQPAVIAAPPLQSSAITLTAQIGFDGFFQRNSRFVPVKIAVSNTGPDFDGILRIGKTQSQTGPQMSRRVTLPNQSNKEFFIYVATEDVLRTVSVGLYDEADTLITTVDATSTAMRGDDVLYGVVSDRPSAFGFLTNREPVNGDVLLAQLKATDLPPIATGWQSLDALVLADYDSAQFTPDQLQALQAWLQSGGHLILSTGANSARTVAPLADLLPQISANTQVTSLDLEAESEQFPVEAAVVTITPTAVDNTLFTDGIMPVATQREFGKGRITVIGFDLTLAPINDWDGLADWFVTTIPTAHTPKSVAEYTQWYNLQSAVNALPDALPPSALLLCIFMGVYIMVLGPINFIVLQRMKKRTWAWVTIPALVLLFSLFSYGIGYSRSGITPTLHRLSIISAAAESTSGQVVGVAGVYSPRRSTYDVTLPNSALPMAMSNTFGGQDTSIGEHPVIQGTITTIPDLQVEVSGLRSFGFETNLDVPVVSAQLQQTQDAGLVFIEGELTLPADLTLERPALLVRGDVSTLEGPLSGTTAIDVETTSFGGQATPIGTGLQFGGPNNIPYGQIQGAIEMMLGSAFTIDRDTYREREILNWYFETHWSQLSSGVFLFGWQATSPLEIGLDNVSYDTNDLTLYIYQLTPTLAGAGDENTLVLTPDLMTYEIVDNALFGDYVNIYDAYFYNVGEFQVTYRPKTSVDFADVETLKMSLDWSLPYQTQDAEISVFNVQTDSWDQIAITGSVVNIENPNDYVNSDGSFDVLMSILNNDLSIELYSLDFTVALNP